MDDANRRALLREVRKSQARCKLLRVGIMVAARYCTYPRWVQRTRSDGSTTWQHERLKLGMSLFAPFSRELDDAAGYGSFLRRVHALERVRRVEDVETTLYPDNAPLDRLQAASSTLSELAMCLRIIFLHAQEYGVCWAWLKATEGPAGTQTFTGVSLAQALVEPSVGRTSDAQFALRKEAADWLTKANALYVGDERQPADLPPPKK